jgi:hypothetical protein
MNNDDPTMSKPTQGVHYVKLYLLGEVQPIDEDDVELLMAVVVR